MFRRKKRSIFWYFMKKSKLEKFYYKNEEFILYSLVSIFCTILLYLLFYIVDKITNGNYILANFISYLLSFSLLFVLNQKLFKSRPLTKKGRFNQLMTFVVIRVVGFPIDSAVLSLLINYSNMNNLVAKIIVSLIMFIYNYITNKLFVFKKNKLL